MKNRESLLLSDILNVVKLKGSSGRDVLANAGIDPSLSLNIMSILNKYSFTSFPMINIIAFLLSSPEPGKGLLRLERFLETYRDVLDTTVYNKFFPDFSAAVFSTSAALSSRLNADFKIIKAILENDNPFLPQTQKNYYYDKLKKANFSADSTHSKIRNIHFMHTAELCRICARSSIKSNPVSEINLELSSLADSVIQSCLDTAIEETTTMSKDYSSFFVLGLGKLGGMELNVSSDIDLIFLSDERQGWGSFEKMSLHTSLSKRLIQLLTEATEYGYLYRVDTRLRADGSSGPIVKTTSDYMRYLEIRGEAWERQMLIKARAVAGNIQAGGKFLEELQRFIYPTSLTRSPNREVVNIKKQIESRLVTEGSKKTHLKLMPGGIRDIEFIVQCLQLLMGGKNPSVRSSGTLDSLSRLSDAGALSKGEFLTLSEAYLVYRKIENVLQWKDLLPAFTIPISKEEIEELGNIAGINDLENKLNHHFFDVRKIFNEIFNSDAEESFEETALNMVLNPTTNEKTSRFLENIGFTEPVKSLKDLHDLVTGKVTVMDEITMPTSLQVFIPKLLRLLSDIPDPGGTLENFVRITDSYNARSALFDLLVNNENFFDLLLSVSSGSLFVTEILEKDPSLIDWLIETGNINHRLDSKNLIREIRDFDRNSLQIQDFTARCLNVGKREIMRTAVRDIIKLSSQEETFADLTDIAETIIKTGFERVFKASGLKNSIEMSVVAAGKLGSGNMNFGSDLDLIFIFRSGEGKGDSQEKSVNLAFGVLGIISGSGGADKIYDVDMRLRPEGGNSPIAVSFEEYERYFEKRASVWEKLALVRAHHITGNGKICNEVDALIEKFVYSRPFTSDEIKNIIKIREKMAEDSVKKYPGLTNVKSNRGGLADIDFIAQTYIVHFGSLNTNLRKRDTRGIINLLSSFKIINPDDADVLNELYIFLSDVQKAIRIGSGKSINTLPLTGPELLRIADLLGFRNVHKFRNKVKDSMTRTREYYNILMNNLVKK